MPRQFASFETSQAPLDATPQTASAVTSQTQNCTSLPRGLTNLGNTCFMSAVIQLLRHATPLDQHLLALAPHLQGRVGQDLEATLADLAIRLRFTWATSIHPSAMRELFVDKFPLDRQQDASEFLLELLQRLRVIWNLFQLKLNVATQCSRCTAAVASGNSDSRLLLDVHLPAGPGVHSLQSLINNVFSDETLDVPCLIHGTCQATRTTAVVLPTPPCLLVRIERCVRLQDGTILKREDPVELPPTLNLPGTGDVYHLRGVVAHHGPSMNAGHYVAVVNTGGANWYLFDDATVSPFDIAALSPGASYLVLYEKPSSSAVPVDCEDAIKYCRGSEDKRNGWTLNKSVAAAVGSTCQVALPGNLNDFQIEVEIPMEEVVPLDTSASSSVESSTLKAVVQVLRHPMWMNESIQRNIRDPNMKDTVCSFLKKMKKKSTNGLDLLSTIKFGNSFEMVTETPSSDCISGDVIGRIVSQRSSESLPTILCLRICRTTTPYYRVGASSAVPGGESRVYQLRAYLLESQPHHITATQQAAVVMIFSCGAFLYGNGIRIPCSRAVNSSPQHVVAMFYELVHSHAVCPSVPHPATPDATTECSVHSDTVDDAASASGDDTASMSSTDGDDVTVYSTQGAETVTSQVSCPPLRGTVTRVSTTKPLAHICAEGIEYITFPGYFTPKERFAGLRYGDVVEFRSMPGEEGKLPIAADVRVFPHGSVLCNDQAATVLMDVEGKKIASTLLRWNHERKLVEPLKWCCCGDMTNCDKVHLNFEALACGGLITKIEKCRPHCGKKPSDCTYAHSDEDISTAMIEGYGRVRCDRLAPTRGLQQWVAIDRYTGIALAPLRVCPGGECLSPEKCMFAHWARVMCSQCHQSNSADSATCCNPLCNKIVPCRLCVQYGAPPTDGKTLESIFRLKKWIEKNDLLLSINAHLTFFDPREFEVMLREGHDVRFLQQGNEFVWCLTAARDILQTSKNSLKMFSFHLPCEGASDFLPKYRPLLLTEYGAWMRCCRHQCVVVGISQRGNDNEARSKDFIKKCIDEELGRRDSITRSMSVPFSWDRAAELATCLGLMKFAEFLGIMNNESIRASARSLLRGHWKSLEVQMGDAAFFWAVIACSKNTAANVCPFFNDDDDEGCKYGERCRRLHKCLLCLENHPFQCRDVRCSPTKCSSMTQLRNEIDSFLLLDGGNCTSNELFAALARLRHDDPVAAPVSGGRTAQGRRLTIQAPVLEAPHHSFLEDNSGNSTATCLKFERDSFSQPPDGDCFRLNFAKPPSPMWFFVCPRIFLGEGDKEKTFRIFRVLLQEHGMNTAEVMVAESVRDMNEHFCWSCQRSDGTREYFPSLPWTHKIVQLEYHLEEIAHDHHISARRAGYHHDDCLCLNSLVERSGGDRCSVANFLPHPFSLPDDADAFRVAVDRDSEGNHGDLLLCPVLLIPPTSSSLPQKSYELDSATLIQKGSLNHSVATRITCQGGKTQWILNGRVHCGFPPDYEVSWVSYRRQCKSTAQGCESGADGCKCVVNVKSTMGNSNVETRVLLHTGPLASMDSFSTNYLSADLVQYLAFLQWLPTSVQKYLIPSVRNNNVLVKAFAGSGKTLAFALYILDVVRKNTNVVGKNTATGIATPIALVLVPTRCLAAEIYSTFQEIVDGCAWGDIIKVGCSYRDAPNTPTVHTHVVIGTTASVFSQVTRKKLSLKELRVFVIDECDCILTESSDNLRVRKLLVSHPEVWDEAIPLDCRRIFVTATLRTEVRETCQNILTWGLPSASSIYTPITLEIGNGLAAHITQTFVEVDENASFSDRLTIVWDDLYNQALQRQQQAANRKTTRTIIFVESNNNTKTANDFLLAASASNPDTRLRWEFFPFSGKTLESYEAFCRDTPGGSECVNRVLIATDFGARGLNFPDVELVYIVYMSSVDGVETYIQRAGRCARGEIGSSRGGRVMTLLCRSYDLQWYRSLLKLMREDKEKPEFMKAAVTERYVCSIDAHYCVGPSTVTQVLGGIQFRTGPAKLRVIQAVPSFDHSIGSDPFANNILQCPSGAKVKILRHSTRPVLHLPFYVKVEDEDMEGADGMLGEIPGALFDRSCFPGGLELYVVHSKSLIATDARLKCAFYKNVRMLMDKEVERHWCVWGPDQELQLVRTALHALRKVAHLYAQLSCFRVLEGDCEKDMEMAWGALNEYSQALVQLFPKFQEVPIGRYWDESKDPMSLLGMLKQQEQVDSIFVDEEIVKERKAEESKANQYKSSPLGTAPAPQQDTRVKDFVINDSFNVMLLPDSDSANALQKTPSYTTRRTPSTTQRLRPDCVCVDNLRVKVERDIYCSSTLYVKYSVGGNEFRISPQGCILNGGEFAVARMVEGRIIVAWASLNRPGVVFARTLHLGDIHNEGEERGVVLNEGGQGDEEFSVFGAPTCIWCKGTQIVVGFSWNGVPYVQHFDVYTPAEKRERLATKNNGLTDLAAFQRSAQHSIFFWDTTEERFSVDTSRHPLNQVLSEVGAIPVELNNAQCFRERCEWMSKKARLIIERAKVKKITFSAFQCYPLNEYVLLLANWLHSVSKVCVLAKSPSLPNNFCVPQSIENARKAQQVSDSTVLVSDGSILDLIGFAKKNRDFLRAVQNDEEIRSEFSQCFRRDGSKSDSDDEARNYFARITGMAAYEGSKSWDTIVSTLIGSIVVNMSKTADGSEGVDCTIVLKGATLTKRYPNVEAVYQELAGATIQTNCKDLIQSEEMKYRAFWYVLGSGSEERFATIPLNAKIVVVGNQLQPVSVESNVNQDDLFTVRHRSANNADDEELKELSELHVLVVDVTQPTGVDVSQRFFLNECAFVRQLRDHGARIPLVILHVQPASDEESQKVVVDEESQKVVVNQFRAAFPTCVTLRTTTNMGWREICRKIALQEFDEHLQGCTVSVAGVVRLRRGDPYIDLPQDTVKNKLLSVAESWETFVQDSKTDVNATLAVTNILAGHQRQPLLTDIDASGTEIPPGSHYCCTLFRSERHINSKPLGLVDEKHTVIRNFVEFLSSVCDAKICSAAALVRGGVLLIASNNTREMLPSRRDRKENQIGETIFANHVGGIELDNGTGLLCRVLTACIRSEHIERIFIDILNILCELPSCPCRSALSIWIQGLWRCNASDLGGSLEKLLDSINNRHDVESKSKRRPYSSDANRLREILKGLRELGVRRFHDVTVRFLEAPEVRPPRLSSGKGDVHCEVALAAAFGCLSNLDRFFPIVQRLCCASCSLVLTKVLKVPSGNLSCTSDRYFDNVYFAIHRFVELFTKLLAANGLRRCNRRLEAPLGPLELAMDEPWHIVEWSLTTARDRYSITVKRTPTTAVTFQFQRCECCTNPDPQSQDSRIESYIYVSHSEVACA